MIITKVFDFDNCTNTDKFKEFKYDYCTKMSKMIDFNDMQNVLEGIKCGLFSSYEYISDGTIWVEPEGIKSDTDKFEILIKPSPKVDNNKGYYAPDELNVIIEYDDGE